MDSDIALTNDGRDELPDELLDPYKVIIKARDLHPGDYVCVEPTGNVVGHGKHGDVANLTAASRASVVPFICIPSGPI